MKIHELLEHHGVTRNPFSEEDAQTDPVFKEHCIFTTFHPSWDKVCGDPHEPSTAVVFGEKGAGKTAMRLQIAAHLDKVNRESPGDRTFVIHYVDFNHFLDRFRDHLSARQRRKIERVLAQWELWDHMDAILTLGVTDVIDEIVGLDDDKPAGPNSIQETALDTLNRSEVRDLLLLAACYDQSTSGTFKGRWERLRRAFKFRTWFASIDFAGACLASLIIVCVATWAFVSGTIASMNWFWLVGGLIAVSWSPWLWRLTKNFLRARRIVSNVRVGNRESSTLRNILMRFRNSAMEAQPLPDRKRTDDRYELLMKFQHILAKLGFSGIVVLVDRLDEPHLIHAKPELMKTLLWPIFDNKFLKHDRFGIKLMLPAELRTYVDKEGRDFHERARLDKQNLISSFEWTGESLYDLAETRLQVCAEPGQENVALTCLFDDAISQQRLIDAFRMLRVPRRLFKFLYRLLSDHCNAHTSQQPAWQIPGTLFESTLAVFLREQDAFDRGVGTG